MIKSNVQQLIKMALAEDIGAGDVTSRAVIGEKLRARGRIIAKENTVLAGVDIAREVFRTIDKNVAWKAQKQDGDVSRMGDVIAEIEGRARVLVSGERTALNFLQRLSGIATLTKRFVDEVSGTRAKIIDTRKTAPGWRSLEKYAVRMGGGENHRMGLYDRFLIKNNHIAIAGSVGEAVSRVKKKKKPGQKIEVETRDMKEVDEAVNAGAEIIMLDNMTVSQVREAVLFVKGRAKIEVSGNISLTNVGDYASAGADFISVGRITHSAPASDIHMLIEECQVIAGNIKLRGRVN